MPRNLTTVFRSLETLEKAAYDCRQLGQLTTDMNFNVVDFIVGPLQSKFGDRLTIKIVTDKEISRPAEVRVSNDRRNILLFVQEKIWNDATNNRSEARHILAHEIAHIWLHCDETFGFSEPSEEEHPFISELYFVENQANIFANFF